MPAPTPPPSIHLPEAVFDKLQASTYDANARVFRDGTAAVNLVVESDANGLPRWQWASDADAGSNPRGEIPQATADVITDGTYDAQTSSISYNGQTYKLRLERDSQGHVAKAY